MSLGDYQPHSLGSLLPIPWNDRERKREKERERERERDKERERERGGGEGGGRERDRERLHNCLFSPELGRLKTQPLPPIF